MQPPTVAPFEVNSQRGPEFWLPRLDSILKDYFEKLDRTESPRIEFLGILSLAINRFVDMAYKIGAMESCLILSRADLLIKEIGFDGLMWEQNSSKIWEAIREFEVSWPREYAEKTNSQAKGGRQTAPSRQNGSGPFGQPPPVSTPVESSRVQTDTPSDDQDGELDGTFAYILDNDGGDGADLVATYLMEADELVASAEQALLSFETNNADVEGVHLIFRILHTIKGNSGLLGLQEIMKLTHSMEQYMEPLRKDQTLVNSACIDRLLEGVDILGRLHHNLSERLKSMLGQDAAPMFNVVNWRGMTSELSSLKLN